MISVFQDFFSLLYPRICMACGKTLFKYEDCICTFCEYHLPKTNFHLDLENPIAKIFWGKVPLVSACSYFHFNKGGKVQHLMHQLKYKGRKDIGEFLGYRFGILLKESNLYNTVNIVIPVPMHPDKQRKRGYNQSEMIANGIAKGLNATVDTKSLIKSTATESQTKKSRYSRWQNVSDIFELTDVSSLENKHVLIVDDVVTTGSTIEACATTLKDVTNIKISVATLAYA